MTDDPTPTQARMQQLWTALGGEGDLADDATGEEAWEALLMITRALVTTVEALAADTK